MAQGNDALGSVDWAVVDTGTGEEIAAGHLDLAEGEIAVEEHRTAENIVYYRKTISLSPPFSFSIDEHPDRRASDLKGFILKGERDDAQSFSSEWFNVVSPTEATKLQENGLLTIEIAEGTRGFEVSRTAFETDVSLRITRFDGDPCKEPSRRITIRKGSWIEWPTV